MNQPVKLRFFLTLALLLCLTLPALAQDRWAGDPPPHISLVEGAATLKREGRAEPAVSSMLLLTGDRLRTESGRIEVLFTDQSVLHLDQDTVLDLLSDSLVRLLRGRLRLAVSATSEAERYRVDSPAGWVRIHEPGDYRVAVMMDGDRAATEPGRVSRIRRAQRRANIRGGDRRRALNDSRVRCPSAPSAFQLGCMGYLRPLVRGAAGGTVVRRVVFIALPADAAAVLCDHFRSLWHLAPRVCLRIRVVPGRSCFMATVLQRSLDSRATLRMDMGRVRPVGMANSSLWTLGLLSPRVVLGPDVDVGASLGLLGRSRQTLPAGTRSDRPMHP